MTRTLRYEAQLDAAPEDVWGVLTDFPAYAEWNPFIRRLEGALQVDSRLSVRFGPPLRFTIRPRVTAVDPGGMFRWRGSLGGLFNGEHSFSVAPGPGGGTLFTQSEDFDGVLVPVLWPLLAGSTLRSFEAMGEALSERLVAQRARRDSGYPAEGADQEGKSSTI